MKENDLIKFHFPISHIQMVAGWQRNEIQMAGKIVMYAFVYGSCCNMKQMQIISISFAVTSERKKVTGTTSRPGIRAAHTPHTPNSSLFSPGIRRVNGVVKRIL